MFKNSDWGAGVVGAGVVGAGVVGAGVVGVTVTVPPLLKINLHCTQSDF